MTEQEITCPSCRSVRVNMVAEPVVSHTPQEHGWYGQVHTVTSPMQCECGQDFIVEMWAYKCVASVTCKVKDAE